MTDRALPIRRFRVLTEPAPVNFYRASPDGISLAEALAGAVSFDVSAHRSYFDLATRVCPQNRELIEELPAEELSHRKLREEMADNPDLAEHLQASVESPTTLGHFGAYVTLPLDQNDLSVDEPLAAAEAREQIAREHYGYLAELTPEGPVRDLFHLLREEEDRLVRRIGARWSASSSIL